MHDLCLYILKIYAKIYIFKCSTVYINAHIYIYQKYLCLNT